MRWTRTAVTRMSIASALALASTLASAQGTAFYYGRSVPPELWQAFDQLVVEPDHGLDLASLGPHRAEPVAYLSVGEVARASEQAKAVAPEWVLGENPHWASWVMDVAHPGYRAYVLGRVEALWTAGYHRFFLDTLDSYVLVAHSAEAEQRARTALVGLVRELLLRHPDAKILLNRGFDLLPALGSLVHGVVAESLFDRWDARAKRYTSVPEGDRAWLIERLLEARNRYHLPVTVIDYRPPAQREAARATARRIAELGFAPWVTDSALSSLGVGKAEVVPRRVLILTNEEPPAAQDEAASRLPPSVGWLAPVVEYLGYIPEHRVLGEAPLEADIRDRYQGVITWFTSAHVPAEYASWLRAQLAAGVHFAILGAPGFALDGAQARQLGIEVLGAAATGAVRVSQRDALIGFEAEPPTGPLEVPLLRFVGAGAQPHLRLLDARGGEGTAVVTSAWGGAALSHVFATRGLAGERAWVLDPFAFLERALGLSGVPRPDVTTENGRRVALFLVRVQGLGEPTRLPGRPRAAEILEQQVWSRQSWPHSFDLEVAPGSTPSPADRASAERLLRQPFAERVALEPGQTDARTGLLSLTRVQGLTAGSRVALPIASDLYFLPAGSAEAYPYASVRQTLEYTDAPRRLKPILLDYHAFIGSSPGGLGVLSGLYRWLETEDVYPLRVSEYVARAQAFREQVLVRYLDGAWGLRGGEALSTVRVPTELGYPDLEASPAVASVRRLPQGQYVSFKPGQERRLVLTPKPPLGPHVVQANGVVEAFGVRRAGVSGWQLELRAHGHVALKFELAGLPAQALCSLGDAPRGRRAQGTVDARGHLFVATRDLTIAAGLLSCRLVKEAS